jgi:polyamine oxidase
MGIGYFDGGSSEIPSGITGPVERVVVVGAGIAGLTAANALMHAGVECVVLEARHRIGGRLHTVDVAGWPVDMGGSWIHMPEGNPLTTFAERVGISRVSGNPLPELVGYDCAEGRRLSADEWAESIQMQYETFPEAQGRLLELLGPDASMEDAIETFLGEPAMAGWDLRRAHQALQAVIEAEAADFCREQSLRWMWNELEYEGSYFGDLPSSGYATLIGAMADGVDVRLGVEVSEVAHTPDGVSIRDATGSAEGASHAVATVPLGVLKRGSPRFSPELPTSRKAAIDRMGYGSFEKIVLAFERPFWREGGFPHIVLFPPEPDEPAIWVLGQDGFGGGPILTALVFQSSTHRVLGHSPAESADWILAMLSQAIGSPCPAPLAVATSSWATDPWSGGAYSHIPPGASSANADALSEPIGGRVLFAGEHTQSARLAYADGAMCSGIREAKRLLGSAGVRLGPP